MGQCICGTELCSTGDAARVQQVEAGRVRNIVYAHPDRLRGCKVGWFWVLSGEAVRSFVGQPSGVHIPSNGHVPPEAGQCPECGVVLWSTQQAAQRLGITQSGVQAALAANPADLLAFRVGRFWVVPEPGVEKYRQLRAQAQERAQAEQDLVTAARELLAARRRLAALDNAPGDAAVDGTSAGVRVRVEVTIKAGQCKCGVYRNAKGRPFPHRPGSGRCTADPLLGAVILNCQVTEVGDDLRR